MEFTKLPIELQSYIFEQSDELLIKAGQINRHIRDITNVPFRNRFYHQHITRNEFNKFLDLEPASFGVFAHRDETNYEYITLEIYYTHTYDRYIAVSSHIKDYSDRLTADTYPDNPKLANVNRADIVNFFLRIDDEVNEPIPKDPNILDLYTKYHIYKWRARLLELNPQYAKSMVLAELNSMYKLADGSLFEVLYLNLYLRNNGTILLIKTVPPDRYFNIRKRRSFRRLTSTDRKRLNTDEEHEFITKAKHILLIKEIKEENETIYQEIKAHFELLTE